MHTFSKKLIDFPSTNSFTALVTDYLSSAEQTEVLQSASFSKEGFEKVINSRKGLGVDRALLTGIVSEQYQKLGKDGYSPAVEKNISLLNENTTFTVTTGHQLNLFTGPVYFIYKIVTTINLSLRLQQIFPEYNFVPVYWMASEDHDLDEINHIHLFGKKVEWKPTSKGAAGKIKCEGIAEAIQQVKELIGVNPAAEKLINTFSKSYLEKKNLGEAARLIVHELFSTFGLIILDADDTRLKKLFVSEMKDDVVNQSAFKLVGQTIREIEEKYKAQVHPREINLFYLGENSRERIVEENGSFSVLNTGIKFSKEELLATIDKNPERFSPNVVLRPLYQEKVLPNIAYIGGPAEISYWLEYKRMFEHYGAQLPVLVLRNCVMILDSATQERLKKLGLNPEDAFLPEEELIKKYLKQNSQSSFSMESVSTGMDSLFNELISKVSDIDSTLKASTEAEKQKLQNSLKALDERIRRAEKKKHETALNQIRKLKEKLFPEGVLQERYENILTFYSKYGDDFLNVLVENFDPMEKKFILLLEN